LGKLCLKWKQNQPPKHSWKNYLPTTSCYTFQDLINEANAKGINPSDIEIDQNYEDIEFTYTEYESDESYNKRLADYEEKLKEYNQWEIDNADKIKKHEKEKKLKADKETQDKIDKLKKEIAKQNKLLKELTKEKWLK
jgi:hypothetical protein